MRVIFILWRREFINKQKIRNIGIFFFILVNRKSRLVSSCIFVSTHYFDFKEIRISGKSRLGNEGGKRILFSPLSSCRTKNKLHIPRRKPVGLCSVCGGITNMLYLCMCASSGTNSGTVSLRLSYPLFSQSFRKIPHYSP